MNPYTPPSHQPFTGIDQAVAYLERAIDYEKLTDVDYIKRNFNLDRMESFLDRIALPHRRFRTIHIAGTKGKGSSAFLIENCLRRGGVRTGLHTSPHISSILERMRIEGSLPSETQFCALLGELKPVIDDLREKGHKYNPTFFELTVALSFALFARSRIDWAVVEVGLGGRLDATNVLNPQACVITPIGFDHMDKLGNTAAEIASEKAGILKPHTPLILSRQDYPEASAAILQRADELKCPVWRVGEDITISNLRPVSATAPHGTESPGWRLDIRGPGWSYEDIYTCLLGRHQAYNTASAVGTVELLRKYARLDVPPEAVRRGVASCTCPARVELLQITPPLILDTAHTIESIAALKEAIHTHFPHHSTCFVFGCSADKNHAKMLESLAELSGSVTLTRASSPRAETIENLAESARMAGFTEIRELHDPVDAVRERLIGAGSEDLTCVTGSFFLAGEIRKVFAA